MDKVMTQLTDAFKSSFAGAEVNLKTYPPDRRIGGNVVWDGFDDMDFLDRQREIHRVVAAALDEAGQMRTSMILAFTPTDRPRPEEDW